MSKRKLTALSLTGATVASLIVATPAVAKNNNWETIGTRRISGAVDRETINVRGNERFRAVRMCAARRPLRILGANADFANGGTQDLNATAILRPGECTRAIDLKGQARDITRIRLSYAKFNLISRPATITVQAR